LNRRLYIYKYIIAAAAAILVRIHTMAEAKTKENESWKDTNVAKIGSDDHRDAVKLAANLEEAWKEGTEIRCTQFK
jgi:hypothetical protein